VAKTPDDQRLKVETGSLYPALHRLVKRGGLKAEWGVSEPNQRAKCHRSHHEPGTRGEEVAMWPDERELDEEIRGHLALSLKEPAFRRDVRIGLRSLLRAKAGLELLREHADAWRRLHRWRSGRSRRRGDPRVADAGCARVACRCPERAPIRIDRVSGECG
jgi:Transcriptional regulator PadR-like family